MPLSSGVVERRGGALIHGVSIVGKLRIPRVKWIRDAVKVLRSGELLTVDGYLGIVAVGEPILDLDRSN